MLNISPRTKWTIIIAAAFVVVVALAFAVVSTIFGWWPIVVDITLVITALASLALLIALTYAAFSLTRTVLAIRAEIMPTLDALKSTSVTVRETAKTASTFGVAPAMRTASAVLGASSVASAILGRGEARTRAEKRQRRRLEIERDLERAERESHASELAAINLDAQEMSNGRR